MVDPLFAHERGFVLLYRRIHPHFPRSVLWIIWRPRELLWILGMVIFLLMMATGFMGYVLPWGQMSFWGATVITNLFSAIPLVGDSIVTLLWGGFSVFSFTSGPYTFMALISGYVC